MRRELSPFQVILLTAAAIPASVLLSLAVVSASLLVAGPLPEDPGALQLALEQLALRPGSLLLQLVASQGAFLAIVLAALAFSPAPAPRRLGLVRPVLVPWAWPLVMAGMLAVRTVAVVAGSWFTGPPSDQVRYLADALHGAGGAMAVALVLSIGLVPAVVEELLFRGVLQRRLVEAWPAGRAVLVTSVLFAVAHLDPQYAILVLPSGAWLGLVAWWSRSTWPAMACHAVNNLLLAAAGVLIPPDYTDWGVVSPGNVALVAACTAFVVGAAWLVHVRGRRTVEPQP